MTTYQVAKQQLVNKQLTVHKDQIEQILLHGSSKTDPKLIYGSAEGFDMRFGSREGDWGQGIYFSRKPYLALEEYAHTLTDGKK